VETKQTPHFESNRVKLIFYATETYIMLFLEPARFLNALDLVGRKVDVLYIPGLAERPPPTPAVYIPLGVWALKQPLCSHLH